MPKRLITPTAATVRSRSEGWLDVERAVMVGITSEEKDHLVESAFSSGETQGWRAAGSGPQTIRLIFDQPQSLNRISLIFEENEVARTQEFFSTMEFRRRRLVSRNCPPAVELQPSGNRARG